MAYCIYRITTVNNMQVARCMSLEYLSGSVLKNV
jgi:hypothetical protein